MSNHIFSVTIQQHPFDLIHEQKALIAASKNPGAIVSFQGLVRAFDQTTPLAYLWLEYFPNVTESAIEEIIQIAKKRWKIEACRVIHRIGKLHPSENIVLVITVACHRKEAFLANEFIMDYLKTQAPFWKCEYFNDGSHQWVEPKKSDQTAAKQWKTSEHETKEYK